MRTIEVMTVDKLKLYPEVLHFMVLGAMLVGGMVGNYAARIRFESMSIAQTQQAQIDQATTRRHKRMQLGLQTKHNRLARTKRMRSKKN